MKEPLSIDALFARADLGSESWWNTVRALGTPLRRRLPDGATELCFLWRDPAGGPQRSDTAAVYIDVYSHTPHLTQQLTGFARWGETDVWYWRTRLASDWLGSYFLMPVPKAESPPPTAPSERRRWWMTLMDRYAQGDALNPDPPHSNAWGLPLSAIRLQHGAWAQADAAPQAALSVQQWRSAKLGNNRRVWCYRTGSDTDTDTDADALPLVLLLDGHYWAQYMPLYAALDAKTARGELPPALYVFIDSLDLATRGRELPCNEDFWTAVQNELLPQLRTEQRFSDDPARTLIAGQSYGGLAAAYAALRWPQRFGRALSQSGSFWWPDADTGTPGWLTQQIAAGMGSRHRLDVHIQIGCYETDMLGPNRALRDALQAAGHCVNYREFRGGHDWLCWREGLLQGLAELMNPKEEHRTAP